VLRTTSSGVLFVLLLASVFMGTFNVQSANVKASSRGETVQATGTDWWPMFRHDLNRTGTSTSMGPITDNLLWKSPDYFNIPSSCAVVDGMVYFGSEDNNVHCLDATNGALVWNYTTGWQTNACPAVAGGLVYEGSMDRQFYCLNATTGEFVWSYPTAFWVVSSAAVVDGKVYVGGLDYRVYCMDALTGAHVWQYRTAYQISSSPAVVDGFVYVGIQVYEGSNTPNVYCLNAATGAVVWTCTTGSTVDSSPAVVDGLVYVGSKDWKVYCLNASTGAIVWSYTTGGDVLSSPAVAGGLLYIGSTDWKVYCLNAATGQFVWSYPTGSDVLSSPAVAGGLVYVGSNDGFLYCLNATTGARVWRYNIGNSIERCSPAVADGVVYVGSVDGHIYAFGPSVAVSISPSSVVMDVGQSKQFNSSVTGGASPYTYQWYLNDVPVSGATSSSWTFTPTSSGSYTIYVTATGQVGGRAQSNIATVTVNPVTVSISPSSVVMDVGQSKQFNSSVTGGTSLYTYQWYLNDAPVSGATSSSWTFTPSSSGSCTVYVNATDNVGKMVKSNIVTATVNTAPSITMSPTSVTMDVGQAKLFTSSASGGTSPYSYQWYVNDAPVSGATSFTWTFTPSSSGSYYVKIIMTDNVDASIASTISNVAVNPQLAVTISPSNATINSGESQNLTSVVYGGTAPYAYQWYVNGAPVSGATSNSWTFTPSSSDNTLYLLVIDSVGEVALSSPSNIMMLGAQAGPESQPLFFSPLFFLLPLFIIATLIAVIVYRRRFHTQRAQKNA